MSHKSSSTSLMNRAVFQEALVDAFRKLTPRQQWKNPVMFVVYIGSLLTTFLWLQALAGDGEEPAGFILAMAIWLWFTVLFANFAEAVAEGRSKAQAAFLRTAKRDIAAKKLDEPRYGSNYSKIAGSTLRRGDVVLDRSRRFRPRRWRSHRRRGLGGRKRHHRRKCAGDPRIRRRLQFSDRRHSGIVGLAGGAHHRQSGRSLFGPHDLHGGKRQAAKNPQRNCLDYLAGGVDLGFSAGYRDLAAVLALQRGNRRVRPTDYHHRVGGVAGLPDSDDDRRVVVGYWRGGYWPDDAEKCRLPRPAGRWKRRATWTYCCWTRPVRLP